MGTIDHSKIGRRSKRRGKTYERRCAKILTEFTGVNYRSTPGSGGFNKFGGVKIREELFCGDLICDNSDFRYCIEAKNREEFSFTAILKSPDTASFTRWWHQCVDDANNVNLEPLMFFKPNKSDDFIVMTQKEWFDKYNKCPFIAINCYDKPLTLMIDDRKSKKKTITVELPNAVMVDWKQFIDHHDPKLMFKG